ncbi:hypothetical protein TRIUR3_23401 [Triticum urartu]|uniref:Uncharacterized protein n=1 Tax=Triticum urartu TaxID=4572 RepID=M7ZGG9_TRIUA|nr:hypothetical protein TRIUR3_23401 [Triticum urartu]
MSKAKALVQRCLNLKKSTNGSWRILVLGRSPEKNLASTATWSHGLGVEQGSKANEGRGERCCCLLGGKARRSRARGGTGRTATRRTRPAKQEEKQRRSGLVVVTGEKQGVGGGRPWRRAAKVLPTASLTSDRGRWPWRGHHGHAARVPARRYKAREGGAGVACRSGGLVLRWLERGSRRLAARRRRCEGEGRRQRRVKRRLRLGRGAPACEAAVEGDGIEKRARGDRGTGKLLTSGLEAMERGASHENPPFRNNPIKIGIPVHKTFRRWGVLMIHFEYDGVSTLFFKVFDVEGRRLECCSGEEREADACSARGHSSSSSHWESSSSPELYETP